MPTSQHRFLQTSHIESNTQRWQTISPLPPYSPAVLKKTSKGFIIEYYVLNPYTNERMRYIMRLNRIRKRFTHKNDFLMHANSIVCNLNAKLAAGWTPFGTTELAKQYTPIADVMQQWIDYKTGEVGDSAIRDYKSFRNLLCDWLQQNTPNCPVIFFNKVRATEFLDYLLTKRKISNVTYNNRIKQGSAFFAWALQRGYCKENPFANISQRRVGQKQRKIIPSTVRTDIVAHLQQTDTQLLIFMELVYYALIRPVEITRVQIQDICFDKHYIYLPPTKTKNGKERYCPLSDELITRLQQYLQGYEQKADWYLFGVNQCPAPKSMNAKVFRKRWARLRKELNLPDEYKIYSLRDTSISALMIEGGADAITTMQAAGHHDLSITTRYANHYDPNLVERVREKQPSFG